MKIFVLPLLSAFILYAAPLMAEEASKLSEASGQFRKAVDEFREKAKRYQADNASGCTNATVLKFKEARQQADAWEKLKTAFVEEFALLRTEAGESENDPKNCGQAYQAVIGMIQERLQGLLDFQAKWQGAVDKQAKVHAVFQQLELKGLPPLMPCADAEISLSRLKEKDKAAQERWLAVHVALEALRADLARHLEEKRNTPKECPKKP